MTDRYKSGDYLEQNPTWHVEDSPWKARQILEMVRRNDLSPATVCEVGCGAGEILAQLQTNLPAGVEFTGFDLSPQAIELCARRSNEHLNFRLADLLAERSARFDLLLVIDVFEHVPDYMGFVSGLREKAEYKIFHIPLELTVWNLLRAHCLMVGRRKFGHLHYFSKESALATLEDCGYTVVDHFYTPSSFELPNPSATQRFLNLPRRLIRLFSEDASARFLGGTPLLVLAR